VIAESFLGADRNIETRTACLLRFHQNDLLRIHTKVTTSIFMLQREQPFNRDLGNAAPSAARIFHPQLSLENTFDCKDRRKEVTTNYSGDDKRILL
jgi:hypothetical protein